MEVMRSADPSPAMYTYRTRINLSRVQSDVKSVLISLISVGQP